MQTAPGKVEIALMHVADVDASVVDSRVGAMHTVNPFHTFMFDSDGVLLNANAKALEAFARHTTGEHAPYCLLLNSRHCCIAHLRLRLALDIVSFVCICSLFCVVMFLRQMLHLHATTALACSHSDSKCALW